MAWATSVEKWRPLVAKHNNNLPIEFLLAWIAKESGGNPASLGAITEVGIFQIDMQDGPRYGGTLESLHRNFAAPSSQTLLRPLTDAEKVLQVTTGVAMVADYRDRSRARLAEVYANWPEGSSDFWSLVKWHHNLPAYTKPLLRDYVAANGAPPGTFDAWAAWVNGGDRPSYVSERYWNTSGTGLSKYTNGAAKVGAYGGVELPAEGTLLEQLAIPAVVVGAVVVSKGKKPV